MKKALIVAAALGLSLPAAGAYAADLSYPTKAPPVFTPAPVFSWTGFYIGANVGYGWADTDRNGAWYDYYTEFYGGGDLKADGWFGGVQLGYNYQFTNNVVLGVEADFQFGDISDSRSYDGYWGYYDDGYQYNDVGSIKAEIESFGTLRARLGYAVDRFLPYITGGLAWGNVKVTDRWDNYVWGDYWDSYSYSKDDTLWGWTIGVGAEYAITDNWTVKIEYLYADLGSIDFNGHYWNNDMDVTLQTVKLGVNYKF